MLTPKTLLFAPLQRNMGGYMHPYLSIGIPMAQKDRKKLVIAVPKGRILKDLTPLLQRVGLEVEDAFYDADSRQLRFATNHEHVEIIRVRSFDVATFVAFGAAHIGVAGSDVLMEFDYPDIYAPLDLNVGHCHLALAAPKEHVDDDLRRLSHIRVATKYPNITRRYFADKGIQAECVKLSGAMEIAPILNLSTHIVDLVSTGTTLRTNGLLEVERIAHVSSRLIVNRTAFKTRSQEINSIIQHCRQIVQDVQEGAHAG